MDRSIAATTINIVDDRTSKSLGTQKPAVTSQAQPTAHDPDQVRILTPAEYKPAAAALAEAFIDDHVARYFIDTPAREHWTAEEKWDLHVAILEYITYAHLLKGLVVSCGPNYGCVALWMPPGANMDDLWTVLLSGLWRLSYKLCAEGRKRFFSEFLPVLNDTKRQVLGHQHDLDSWYLVYIGTREEARGKGYARKCVEYVTKGKADPEGRKCYLESSNDVNPIIYGRLGFQVRKKISLNRAAEPIELDIMVREPAVGT